MMDRFAQSIRRTAAAAFLLLAVPTGPAVGEVQDEIALAMKIVEETVLQLDSTRHAEERGDLLQRAVEAFGVLEGFAGGELKRPEAADALKSLGAQAITGDVLRLGLVEAFSNGLVAGEAGLQRDLAAKSVAATLTDPAYRSAAWAELGRAHLRVAEPAEAERLAARAIEEAQSIVRQPTRDGALRAAVLISPPDEPRLAIVEMATNAMTSAGARSEIYRFLANAELGRAQKTSKQEIARAAQQSLAKKNYPAALQAAQAMERDDESRSGILNSILEAELALGDEQLALQVAKSMARNKEQNTGLRKIIDLRIDRGKPLRAQELVPLLLTVSARTDAQIAIAVKLDEQGYKQAALDILASIHVSPVEDADAAADLVSALAKFSVYDKARELAAQITDSKRKSFAFSRLSKRLSDDALTKEAAGMLGEIGNDVDLSYAKSGLARALVKKGQLDTAEAMLETISRAEDRDRVLEQIARTHVAAGRLDEARQWLKRIDGHPARSRVLVEVALLLDKSNHKAAMATLVEARELLSGPGQAEELANVAIGYARLGDITQSDKIIRSIDDEKVKDKTRQRIAELLVRHGALSDARNHLLHIAADGRGAATGYLASAQFEEDGNIEALLAAVRELPFAVRVSTLRKAAEIRARALDKSGWLSNPDADAIGRGTQAHTSQKANFVIGQHLVHAPAPAARPLSGVRMPEIFDLTASVMRAKVPAPAAGVAHLAILGFSPFSLEAFKLTSSGTAAVHQVQISQNLTWPRYIAVEKGVVTLGAMLTDLPETRTRNLLINEGDTILIRVPIIVLPGATLLMSGAEFSQYRLGAQSGAFLAVAGKLFVQDTEVIGYDEEAGVPAVASEETRAVFRPFITAWGGSDLQLAGSRFAMLGYDSSKAFGLTQSSGAAVQSLYSLVDDRPTGSIVDNSFENLRYGYYSYEAKGIKIIGNEFRDNVVYGIDPHDRSRDMLIALNTAYGSRKKHGIIVSREVDDSFIVGNVSVLNKGSGLMLDRTSSRNIVYANTSSGNEGDGLTFYESGCNIAAANDLSRNKRAGIKIRNSTHVGVYNNQLNGNVGNGADIYISDLRQSPEGHSRDFELDPFKPIATSIVAGNSFADNGNAINAAGASEIILDANRFRNQRSNIYGGDLRPLSPFLLQLGDRSALLVGMTCQPTIKVDSCQLGNWGGEQSPDVVCTGMSAPASPNQENGVASDG